MQKTSGSNNNLFAVPTQNPPISSHVVTGTGVAGASGSERPGPGNNRHIKIRKLKWLIVFDISSFGNRLISQTYLFVRSTKEVSHDRGCK